jgi:hypothetical protein
MSSRWNALSGRPEDADETEARRQARAKSIPETRGQAGEEGQVGAPTSHRANQYRAPEHLFRGASFLRGFDPVLCSKHT